MGTKGLSEWNVSRGTITKKTSALWYDMCSFCSQCQFFYLHRLTSNSICKSLFSMRYLLGANPNSFILSILAPWSSLDCEAVPVHHSGGCPKDARIEDKWEQALWKCFGVPTCSFIENQFVMDWQKGRLISKSVFLIPLFALFPHILRGWYWDARKDTGKQFRELGFTPNQ